MQAFRSHLRPIMREILSIVVKYKIQRYERGFCVIFTILRLFLTTVYFQHENIFDFNWDPQREYQKSTAQPARPVPEISSYYKNVMESIAMEILRNTLIQNEIGIF